MQQLDKDMDELDQDYDLKLGDLLKPEDVMGDADQGEKKTREDK